jgi:hypothetical protein
MIPLAPEPNPVQVDLSRSQLAKLAEFEPSTEVKDPPAYSLRPTIEIVSTELPYIPDPRELQAVPFHLAILANGAKVIEEKYPAT